MNKRLCTLDQRILVGHEWVHQVYTVGQEVPIPPSQFEDDAKPNQPIIYTTKGSDIDEVSIFLQFPQGFQRVNELGVSHGQRYEVSIKYKPVGSDPANYIDADGSPFFFTGKGSDLPNVQARFKRIDIIFTVTGQYDIRIFIQDINRKYVSTG